MKSTEGNQTKQFKDNIKNNKRTERKEQIKKKNLEKRIGRKELKDTNRKKKCKK